VARGKWLGPFFHQSPQFPLAFLQPQQSQIGNLSPGLVFSQILSHLLFLSPRGWEKESGRYRWTPMQDLIHLFLLSSI
jgi:hypothetical protein